MKPSQMDADLAKITEPQQMSYRLSHWETRIRLTRGLTADDLVKIDQIKIKHAARVARLVRIG
jgi:hypothetical protein